MKMCSMYVPKNVVLDQIMMNEMNLRKDPFVIQYNVISEKRVGYDIPTPSQDPNYYQIDNDVQDDDDDCIVEAVDAADDSERVNEKEDQGECEYTPYYE
ncbi:MAG: hypothetical protein EZS28_001182 [Streblomastix strix]|uniref:Uncharacterized protein n=1 Tax=Streblomastix strix TaxID=222440 RepID=A0A5J4X7R7_9EUKA|nr:MAG: hypothetical protein EZS28_001182 [Streblomastix strix]